MSLIKVPCMQITNMHCSGQTVSLAAGDYHATIVTVGAGLAELTFQGCHLVIPHKPEEMPLAHLGKVLIPWPNRIANGCYPLMNIVQKPLFTGCLPGETGKLVN